MAALGLYIHVPFCKHICNYCNFSRCVFDDGLKARYVGAVETQIAKMARRFGPDRPLVADTIYFGGGTPSLLDPDEIGRIVDACRHDFDVAAGAEVTMEVNPDTAGQKALDGFRAAGVNRLSVGVQSFRGDELRRLDRLHDQVRARQAVSDARAAGFDNISIDLMMGLPGQSLADWRESVDGLIEVSSEHASLYILEIYPHAPLREQMARLGLAQVPDDAVADMYEFAMETVETSGLRQYEISNVAKPGCQSRHNLKYWTDGDWLGVGPAAHSTFHGVRWNTCSGLEEYLSAIEAGSDVERDIRVLTPKERWEEALITGLRLTDGMAVDDLRQKYGLEIWARYGDHLQPYLDAGLLRHEKGRLRLSRQGMLLANDVLSVFI